MSHLGEGRTEADDLGDGHKGLDPAMCPSCLHKVSWTNEGTYVYLIAHAFQPKDEPIQQYGLRMTIDGNSQWKRLDRRTDVSGRVFDNSVLRISPVEVDRYQGKLSDTATTDLSTDTCADSFRAAHGDSKIAKSHWDETGIFPLLCRHGIVWKYVDMVRTREA